MSANPETIGRYRVLDRVGRGGMGVLYRGVDPVLEREVAIKLMLADFSEDEAQMRPRFYREARAVARLQHRNIVTIFEFAEEGSTPYIVMEFLRGRSLAARAAAPPPLTLDDKLRIVGELCAGLQYAHDQGIVHRDVKPANIFILDDGAVKLLDFGIAKLTTSTLTRQGDVLGSASYMSPEQVSGSDAIDGRADVFSTGVVLYELLAGRKPFLGDSPTAIIVKILQEDPPPLADLVPGTPAALVSAVNRALAKDPAERYPTAADFGRDLDAIRQALKAGDTPALDETRFASTSVIRQFQQQIEGKAAAAARPRWMLPAAVIAGVVALGAIGVATYVRGGPDARPARTDGPAAVVPAVDRASSSAAPAPLPASRDATRGAPAGTPLQIDSDPPGASILVDGRDTHRTTPSTVTVEGAGPHRLRLTKGGFQALDARLGDAELRKGALAYTLRAAEAATIPVTVTGPYAFQVFDGAKPLSGPSESHDLTVPAGHSLRLVAPDYLLNLSVHVDGAPGRRMTVEAPALGKLNVLTNYETCSVRINGRDLGYPPIHNQAIAAGTYKIDLICPNGQNQVGSVVVAPGQLATARIF